MRQLKDQLLQLIGSFILFGVIATDVLVIWNFIYGPLVVQGRRPPHPPAEFWAALRAKQREEFRTQPFQGMVREPPP